MRNSDEKNYLRTHTFKEKHVLLECNENEGNDEIIRRKTIDICSNFSIFHHAKI